MYCSNCGSDMVDGTCMSCQRSLPSTARGKIDLRTGLMLAGWWRRVGSTFSDYVVLLLPTLIIYSLFAELDGLEVGAFVALASQGVYFVKILSGARGQSLGNRVAATRVRDATSGRRITLSQSFKRWGFVGACGVIFLIPSVAAELVAFLVIVVDSLFPLWDPRSQTLHDKFANTIVVIA
jgi:uncharacterized RDD family membrane protein YckC